MKGIYYLLSIIAIAGVIWWYYQNDGRGDGEPTTGILRMREQKHRPRKNEPPERRW